MRRGSPKRSHEAYEILGLLNTTKADKSSIVGTVRLQGAVSLRNWRYHMTRAAPGVLSIANYLPNPRMKAVRDSASRARKSRTALRDVICDNFVAVKMLTVVI